MECRDCLVPRRSVIGNEARKPYGVQGRDPGWTTVAQRRTLHILLKVGHKAVH